MFLLNPPRMAAIFPSDGQAFPMRHARNHAVDQLTILADAFAPVLYARWHVAV